MRYPLFELLLLALTADVGRDDRGTDEFVKITLWREQNLAFLGCILPYWNCIPSHNTMNYPFDAKDPELFKACCLAWVEDLREGASDLIAIGGETSRGGHDRDKGRKPLHMVSA